MPFHVSQISAVTNTVFLTLSKPFQVPQSISIHPYCVPYIIEAISSTPKHQHSSILCSLHYRSHFKYPKASAFIYIVVFLTLSARWSESILNVPHRSQLLHFRRKPRYLC